jgi:hypothetical protein
MEQNDQKGPWETTAFSFGHSKATPIFLLNSKLVEGGKWRDDTRPASLWSRENYIFAQKYGRSAAGKSI